MDAPSQAQSRLAVSDYVEVVNTDDEWESLIGIIDSISSDNFSTDGFLSVSVYFPLRETTQYSLRLKGVNFFTDYIRLTLRQNGEIQIFSEENLEIVDEDSL